MDEKARIRESTIQPPIRALKGIARRADLLNPESVKAYLASSQLSENRKEKVCDDLAGFYRYKGIHFDRPRYRRVEKLPFIPLQSEIDQLTSGVGKKTATFLQLLKETAIRPGEAWNLRWIDIDCERASVSITPEKYHDKIAAIITREWESRTQLERESYAAKVVEALTAAVLAEATKEATTGEIFVPICEIKHHYDLRYADAQTGKGRTNARTIGRVISNLRLRTDQFRVRDEEGRLRGWRLDKMELVRIRQSLYLDEVPEFVSNVLGTSVGSISSLLPSSALPLETNETKPVYS